MAAFQGPLSNRICQLCEERQASHFCNCRTPATVGCIKCLADHYAKYPRFVHQLVPIAALYFNPEEYTRKVKALEEGATELRRSLERIDQFSHEFQDMIQRCVNYLTDYSSWLLQSLQKEKTELSTTIEAAVQEATKCLDEGTQPESGLGKALWTLPVEALQVFSYSVTIPDLKTLCQTWASYQITLESVCASTISVPEDLPYQPQEVINSPQPNLFSEDHLQTQHTLPVTVPQPVQRESTIEITEAMKADFHRPSEEDFQRRREEIPKYIGRHRLPIESLQGTFQWNSLTVQKFQALSLPYSAWRKSRGDGNSFYRCLGVLLLEHYCRPDTPLQYFHTVANEMISQDRHFVFHPRSEQDIMSLKLFLRLLIELYSMKFRGENAFQHLQYCLQRQSIDQAMIIAMRQYTASYLQLNFQHPDLAPFIENLPNLLAEINEFGKEAEGLELWVAARCFSIVLHILTVDNKSSDITEIVYGPESQGWYPSFSVLHLPGHYNYLIRREIQEADRYDFASNTYSPVQTWQSIGYEQFSPNS